MLRFISDEDVNGHVIRGLRRHAPHIDLVRVQDVGLMGAPDPDVLEWAAQEERVLITEDAKTMIGHANARVQAGLPMPGLLVINQGTSAGEAIEDITLIAECYHEDDVRNLVIFIPLWL